MRIATDDPRLKEKWPPLFAANTAGATPNRTGTGTIYARAQIVVAMSDRCLDEGLSAICRSLAGLLTKCRESSAR